MKLVREHINEIFTEDSDPIHDMGIGIENAVKRIKKYAGRYTYSPNDEDVFDYCIYHLKDQDLAISVMDYLIQQGRVDLHYSVYLSSAVNTVPDERALKFVKYLLDNNIEINIYDIQNAEYASQDILKLIKEYIFKTKNKIGLDYFLERASRLNDTAEVIKIIKSGADPSIKKHKILQDAIRHKNKELVNFLLPYLEKDVKYK
jgi:hypothetical protein